ncbi:unnamed protein product [Chrysodeixis includens]|uniref:Uncharacterized protein n=1 Tax=Chrysodeixis includens TaxID=689277 RepID=A0A9N8PZ64_CHRIL|nr:unnamed protein product [Chrysodeixis includens]
MIVAVKGCQETENEDLEPNETVEAVTFLSIVIEDSVWSCFCFSTVNGRSSGNSGLRTRIRDRQTTIKVRVRRLGWRTMSEERRGQPRRPPDRRPRRGAAAHTARIAAHHEPHYT